MAHAPGIGPHASGGHDREEAREQRDPPVAPAEVSDAAKAKAASKCTPHGLPAHSFRTLLADLGTVTMNWMVLSQEQTHEIPVLAERTPLQRRAFELLGADPKKMFPR